MAQNAVRKRGQQKLYEIWARWFRAMSTIALLIFLICYILGAFIKIGSPADIATYFRAGAIIAVLLSNVYIIYYFILTKSQRKQKMLTLKRFFILFPVFFVAGNIQYYMINHIKYNWIIFALLIIAVILNIFEFSVSLKGVWKGQIISRERTLVQFIYLYVTTILSFTLLYLILDPNVPHKFFKMDHAVDPLVDFLYLSIITASTVGYGDIVPVTAGAKLLISLQTVIGYIFLSILVGLIVSWTGRASASK